MSNTPPSMHKPIPMGTRVSHKTGYGTGYPDFTGTVVGIASIHAIYHYIVALDLGIVVDGEIHTALSVPGTLLVGTDGKSFAV